MRLGNQTQSIFNTPSIIWILKFLFLQWKQELLDDDPQAADVIFCPICSSRKWITFLKSLITWFIFVVARITFKSCPRLRVIYYDYYDEFFLFVTLDVDWYCWTFGLWVKDGELSCEHVKFRMWTFTLACEPERLWCVICMSISSGFRNSHVAWFQRKRQILRTKITILIIKCK